MFWQNAVSNGQIPTVQLPLEPLWFTVFMADGMFKLPPARALTAKWEDVVFFDFIRALYGRFLAVKLFSGIAVGTHQYGYGR